MYIAIYTQLSKIDGLDGVLLNNECLFERILVTGGCGFIGSNFIRNTLNNNGSTEIINLDLLTYAGNRENLSDLEDDPRYKFVHEDILNARAVHREMRKCDAVVHFAAESHVDRSIKGEGNFISTNVLGTDILLRSALENMNKIKKFIMISTDEVYGDISPGYSSKEDDPLFPRNPYAASKAGADRLAYSYYSTYGLPVIITRSSNNFGPYQYPEKLIPLFITNLIEGKKVPLYGDGKNIRDWIYVEDNCRAIDLVLREGRNGEVYNIGGGNEIENIEITRSILELMNKDESDIEYVEDRKGHDRRYSLDSSKIHDELGWKSKYKFDDAFRSTIKWYKSNEKWWKSLKIS